MTVRFGSIGGVARAPDKIPRDKEDASLDEAMSKTMQVSEYMRRGPFTLSPGMSIRNAMDKLLEQRLSSAPVVDGGELVGVFSESDALKAALDAGYHGTDLGRVEDCMSREVHSVRDTASIQEAAELFLRHHRRAMPVIRGERLVGHLSRGDILRVVVSRTGSMGESTDPLLL